MRSEEEFDRNLRLNITIPWDTNTFVGWVSSVVLCLFLLLLILPNLSDPKQVIDRSRDRDSILIVLGEINGLPEPEGGNVQKKGTEGRGEEREQSLEDNSPIASSPNKGESKPDLELTTQLNPTQELPGSEIVDSAIVAGKRRGSEDPANPNGIGLNPKTPTLVWGPGAGLGIGDVTWNGGGNRTVLNKVTPKYPRGVNTSAEIRVAFKVDKEGNVVDAYIQKKGHAMLERAALDAIWKWRFNPDPQHEEMFGVVPFSFKVR